MLLISGALTLTNETLLPLENPTTEWGFGYLFLYRVPTAPVKFCTHWTLLVIFENDLGLQNFPRFQDSQVSQPLPLHLPLEIPSELIWKLIWSREGRKPKGKE